MKMYSYYIRHLPEDDFAYKVKHHIIPLSQGGRDNSDNIVEVTPAQHCWLHILLDKEGYQNSANFFLNALSKNIDEIESFEDCLPYNEYFVEVVVKSCSDTQKEYWADPEKRAYRVKQYSDAKKGKVNTTIGSRWMSNGEELVRVHSNEIDDYLDKGYYFSSSRGTRSDD